MIKTKQKQIYFIFIILLLFAFLFRNYILWMIKNIKGKETILSIQLKLEKKRNNDFKNLFGNINDIKKIKIIGIKNVKKLEVWVMRSKSENRYIKLKEYDFTSFSGKQGPKLKRGDGQIPEGFYGIEYLNPNSRFYLSMKLTYPNSLDKEMGKKEFRNDLGDDIFIHGKNVTVGCIPIGNKNIEELFYLVSKVGKQNTEVIISPVDFRKDEIKGKENKKEWINKLYKQINDSLNNYIQDNELARDENKNINRSVSLQPLTGLQKLVASSSACG